MELPFIVVFEPPSRAELRAVLRMRGTWVAGCLAVLAIGTLALWWRVGQAEAVAAVAAVPLHVLSQPPAAAVWVDGRERGQTPLEVVVDAGAHQLLLRSPDALDAAYTLQVGPAGATLEAVLWRRQPALQRLRPTLPGAVLADVRMLASGDLALTVALPADRQLQAWRLAPGSGALRPLLSETTATRLSVTPDGQRVAYVGDDVGPAPDGAALTGFGSQPASVVWLAAAGRSAPLAGWRAPLGPSEQLSDVSWSPTADRLLAVATSSSAISAGAVRSRMWFVAGDPPWAQEVLSLPSEVVAGSEVWSPDGQRLVFVARAGELNALCLLDVQGEFRYVADLDPSPTAPLAFPAATWSADSQRLLFVAPPQHPPGGAAGWLQSAPRHALYVAEVAQPAPAPIGDTDVDLAVWREDGQLIGLARADGDGGLEVRLLPTSGNPQRLLALPLRLASDSAYAAAWDPARAQLLIARAAANGGVDYWLVRLGLEGDR